MKSMNGLVFIVLGALFVWIGATGRLPALASALGMVRKAPDTGNKSTVAPVVGSGVSSPSPAVNVPTVPASDTAFGLTPKGQDFFKQVSDANLAFMKQLGW